MLAVTPFLWFDTDLREVIAFYRSVFPDLAVDGVPPGDGPIVTASVTLAGQTLQLLNGGPFHAGFSEAISLMVTVDNQDDLDRLWAALVAGGGAPGRCGWLKDRYGLSWQVVPEAASRMMASPDRARAERALKAVMGMGRIDLAAVLAAADGEV